MKIINEKAICIVLSALTIIVSLVLLSYDFFVVGLIIVLIGFTFFNYTLSGFSVKIGDLISTVIVGIIVYIIWK